MSIRHTVVSTLHTQAELVAFPFSSEAALRFCVTGLCPLLRQHTRGLWREAEARLIGESPALSLDELGAMRDALWFADSDGTVVVPLVHLLDRISRNYLEVSGSFAHPSRKGRRSSEAGARSSPADGLEHMWRWLSFALPPDLLLAALAGETAPHEVFAVAPNVAALLSQEGFAETHVHQGAAMSFGALWASAMRAVAAQGMKSHSLASPGAALGEGGDLAPWLLRAAVARYVLAEYLSGWALHRGEMGTLQDFVAQRREELASGRGWSFVTAVFDRALGDLRAGALSGSVSNFAALQSLYAGMSGVRRRLDEQGTAADILALDPLHRFWAGDRRWPSPEVWFSASAIRYLRSLPPAAGDRLFEDLFWQVVRVRCLVYRHVVQRPMTPGLQWFVRVYSRLKPLRSAMKPRLRSLAALEVCGERHGLAALELRIGPESTVGKVLAELKAPEPRETGREGSRPSRRAARLPRGAESSQRKQTAASVDAPPVETGYIVHFIRDRGGFDRGAHRAHWQGSAADPSYDVTQPSRGNPTGYRYAQYYIKQRRQALVLARTLTLFPVALELIRGVDVCTDEAGVPTWVMAPLLRYVCEAGQAASVALHRWRDQQTPPLRRAVHAGEDFVHLLSGMRRLHQSIEHLRVSAGDRVGHGLSLGLDPERWARDCGWIAMSLEDRLFDLAWAWSRIVQGKAGGHTLGSIEHEIRERCLQMFTAQGDQRIGPADIVELVDGLHDEQVLRLAGFPYGPRPPQNRSRPLDLVVRYLTDTAVFRRSKETVWVNPEPEARLLSELQDSMRQEVSNADITVEVNPTSNLLIGHVPDLRDHPLWRLAPGPHKRDAPPPLPICVGSDDPVTFATTLPQEYQLLYDALVQDGATAVQAQHWLDHVRRTGMQRRFTLRRSNLKLTEPIPVNARLTMPP